jgi:hypothetical protein
MILHLRADHTGSGLARGRVSGSARAEPSGICPQPSRSPPVKRPHRHVFRRAQNLNWQPGNRNKHRHKVIYKELYIALTGRGLRPLQRSPGKHRGMRSTPERTLRVAACKTLPTVAAPPSSTLLFCPYRPPPSATARLGMISATRLSDHGGIDNATEELQYRNRAVPWAVAGLGTARPRERGHRPHEAARRDAKASDDAEERMSRPSSAAWPQGFLPCGHDRTDRIPSKRPG